MKSLPLSFFVLGLSLATPLVAQAQRIVPGAALPHARYDFYGRKPYRSSVPTPAQLLGYEAGDTHSTYREQEKALLAMAAAAKDRVRVFEIGVSVEGRPLRLFAVSSAENLAKLDALRASNLKLSDPRTQSSAEADKAARSAPTFVWINHCIHGDESASFESAMWLLYTLAASESTEVKSALASAVVLINPVFNPDGHERFVVYNNSLALGIPEGDTLEQRQPWGISGRYNHFRFDMNRDKLSQSQPETQAESAAFLAWKPQVFVDQHGQVENYFFPPNSDPVNREADAKRIEDWTSVFGRANAAAFDKYGWQYVTRERFDLYYPGYLDSWTTLSGAIGMTYETDEGGRLAAKRDDGTLITLRDGIAHHFEAALATIEAAAKNRERLLTDYVAYRRSALTRASAEPMKRIVIVPGTDPDRLNALAQRLQRSGIEVGVAASAFVSETAHPYLTPDGKPTTQKQTFPAGSLVVELAQPQGRLAKTLLEPNTALGDAFLKEQNAKRQRNLKKNDAEPKEDYDFYDITAWSLPFAFDLTAFWTEDSAPPATRALAAPPKPTALPDSPTPPAYLIRYDRERAAVLALRLLAKGYRVGALTKPGKAGGVVLERGSFVVRTERNPESVHKALRALATELGVPVVPLTSAYTDEASVGLGSFTLQNLKRPRIAVVADDMVSQTGYGSVWHFLERELGVSFTPIRLRSLRGETLAKFNTVIFPEGYGYAGALGKAGADALREWVSGGGALIGLASGGTWFTEKDMNLTAATVVGAPPADAKPDDKEKEKKPEDRLKERESRPTALPGALFRATLNREHFLGFGYAQDELIFPLLGDTFLKPTTKGSNPLIFPKANLLASGFAWEGNTERLLAETAAVIDEPTGGGHVLLYLSDPTFRNLWPGLNRLLLNGILFGPSRTYGEE
nr:M14 family zinc carboxypeptidase [Armatimonas rosea]